MVGNYEKSIFVFTTFVLTYQLEKWIFSASGIDYDGSEWFVYSGGYGLYQRYNIWKPQVKDVVLILLSIDMARISNAAIIIWFSRRWIKLLSFFFFTPILNK